MEPSGLSVWQTLVSGSEQHHTMGNVTRAMVTMYSEAIAIPLVK